MRGLLYREFYVNKKHYFVFGALAVAFSLLGVMVALSSVCGNIKSFPETDPNAWANTMLILTYLPMIIAVFSVMGVSNSIYSDYSSKWMIYSYTLPTHYRKAVGVRYMAGLIALAMSFLFGLLHGILVNAVAGTEIPSDLVKNGFAIIVIGVAYLVIDVPLAYRFKNARTVEIVEIVSVVVGILAFVLIKLVKYGVEGFEKFAEEFAAIAGEGSKSLENADSMAGFWQLRDILSGYGIIIIPVLVLISLFVAGRIYKRREK